MTQGVDPQDLINNSEHGWWWQAQIAAEKSETSLTGKCEHRTRSLDAYENRWRFTCLSCGAVAYRDGDLETYKPTTPWEQEFLK